MDPIPEDSIIYQIATMIRDFYALFGKEPETIYVKNDVYHLIIGEMVAFYSGYQQVKINNIPIVRNEFMLQDFVDLISGTDTYSYRVIKKPSTNTSIRRYKTVPVCECGTQKHGFASHSTWCPIYE